MMQSTNGFCAFEDLFDRPPFEDKPKKVVIGHDHDQHQVVNLSKEIGTPPGPLDKNTSRPTLTRVTCPHWHVLSTSTPASPRG
jgi:hypothetical protein